jgi:hypothetical protein
MLEMLLHRPADGVPDGPGRIRVKVRGDPEGYREVPLQTEVQRIGGDYTRRPRQKRRIYRNAAVVTGVFFLSGVVSVTPLTGSLHIFDPLGSDLCTPPGPGPGGDVCGDPVTGDYDATAGALSFDPVLFFGADIITRSVELLPPGTHIRNDGSGGSITATVNPGQLVVHAESNVT